jgi:ribosomal protein L6P/L9E
MKLLNSNMTLAIPKNVTVEVKGRAVRVKGPRGTLQREWRAWQQKGQLEAGTSDLAASRLQLCT